MSSGKEGCVFWMISGWFVRFWLVWRWFCWFVGSWWVVWLDCGWFGWLVGCLGSLWVVWMVFGWFRVLQLTPRKMFYNFSFWLNFLQIQLYFSISIMPSIALKRWNFSDNFDFKGKIVAESVGKNSHKMSLSLNIK